MLAYMGSDHMVELHVLDSAFQTFTVPDDINRHECINRHVGMIGVFLTEGVSIRMVQIYYVRFRPTQNWAKKRPDFQTFSAYQIQSMRDS